MHDAVDDDRQADRRHVAAVERRLPPRLEGGVDCDEVRDPKLSGAQGLAGGTAAGGHVGIPVELLRGEVAGLVAGPGHRLHGLGLVVRAQAVPGEEVAAVVDDRRAHAVEQVVLVERSVEHVRPVRQRAERALHVHHRLVHRAVGEVLDAAGDDVAARGVLVDHGVQTDLLTRAQHEEVGVEGLADRRRLDLLVVAGCVVGVEHGEHGCLGVCPGGREPEQPCGVVGEVRLLRLAVPGVAARLVGGGRRGGRRHGRARDHVGDVDDAPDEGC